MQVAVSCASIGCPLLDNRAQTADGTDGELQVLMRRLPANRRRNHYKSQTDRLALSMIFDWCGEDFRRGGHRFLGYAGLVTLRELSARFADLLAETEAGRASAVRFVTPGARLHAPAKRFPTLWCNAGTASRE